MSSRIVVDRHTISLMHFERGFQDDIKKVDWEAHGNPIISKRESVFGTGSAYFDGDSVIGMEHQRLAFLRKDFTAECRLKPTITEDKKIVGVFQIGQTLYPEKNLSLGLEIHEDGIKYMAGGLENWVPTDIDFTEFNHFAIIRHNSRTGLYMNGKRLHDIKDHSIYRGTLMAVGAVLGERSMHTYTGYVDELRVSDTARWKEPFTPEDKEYTKYYIINKRS